MTSTVNFRSCTLPPCRWLKLGGANRAPPRFSPRSDRNVLTVRRPPRLDHLAGVVELVDGAHDQLVAPDVDDHVAGGPPPGVRHLEFPPAAGTTNVAADLHRLPIAIVQQ